MAHIVVSKKYDVDVLASTLGHLAKLARGWPPSWNGARISVPVFAPDSLGYIGRVLPGKGLYVDVDLKSVGITKPVPYVFQRTPVQKILQFVKDERLAIRAASLLLTASLFPKAIPGILFGAITTYQGIVDARLSAKGREFHFTKDALSGAGQFFSYWQANPLVGGEVVTAGSYVPIPGGGTHDKNTPGAWSVGLANPTGGDKVYLIGLGVDTTSFLSYILLADLLTSAGNINADTTAVQGVGTGALPRYSNGEGVMLTFDVETTLGNVASSLLWNYTSQAGFGARTAFDLMAVNLQKGGLPVTGRGPVCQLQLGDFGIRSLESVKLSSPMGQGSFAANLYFPLTILPFSRATSSRLYREFDFYTTIYGLVELTTSMGIPGCLTAYGRLSAGTTPTETGFLLWTVNG